MATTAESAQHWLQEKQPSPEQVQDIIVKLEQRIEQHDPEDPGIDGSMEALEVLQAHLHSLTTPEVTSDDAKLDHSALIPEADPIELEASVKRRAFDALKDQFKDL